MSQPPLVQAVASASAMAEENELPYPLHERFCALVATLVPKDAGDTSHEDPAVLAILARWLTEHGGKFL